MRIFQGALAAAIAGAAVTGAFAAAAEEDGAVLTEDERAAVLLYKDYQACLDDEGAFDPAAADRGKALRDAVKTCMGALDLDDAYFSEMLRIFQEHGTDVLQEVSRPSDPAPR